MPDLFYKPYDFIDVHGLTFNDVQTHCETNIVIKARVKAWLNQFEEQVQPFYTNDGSLGFFIVIRNTLDTSILRQAICLNKH